MSRDTVPPEKEVQHGTEGIEVLESAGPVLAGACSAMAEIPCAADSVLPGARLVSHSISLVEAEADS